MKNYRRSLALLVVLPAMCWALTARAQSPQGSQTTGQAPSAPQSQATAPSPTAAQPQQGSRPNAQAPAQQSAGPQMQVVQGAQQESLADAARRTRAQKAKAAAKVVTDDDVSNLSSGGVSVVGDGSSESGDYGSGGGSSYAAPSGGESSSGSGAAGDNGEKYWRGRAREIMNQIAATDQQISKLKDEIAKTGPTGVDPTTGLTQNVIIIHDRNAQLKQLEERKASLQKQLDDLADEGRRAGADSSWFR
jgi:hypothetical protein